MGGSSAPGAIKVMHCLPHGVMPGIAGLFSVPGETVNCTRRISGELRASDVGGPASVCALLGQGDVSAVACHRLVTVGYGSCTGCWWCVPAVWV